MSHPPSIGPEHDNFFAQVASSVVKPQAISVPLGEGVYPAVKDRIANCGNCTGHCDVAPCPNTFTDWPSSATKPAAPPTKDEQIKALRVAVDALLTHGLRSDIVEQARHVMEVTA